MEEIQLKTAHELQRYYYTTLKRELLSVEKKRKEIVQKMYGVGIVLGLVFFLVVFLVKTFHLHSGLIIFTICVCAIVWSFMYSRNTADYAQEFKTKIIQKIINFIDNKLTYTSHNYIPNSNFQESKIFPITPDRYQGDDYVSGVIGQTEIAFSEIHAEYKKKKGRSNVSVDGSTFINLNIVFALGMIVKRLMRGELIKLANIGEEAFSDSKWETLFKGLFFVADFNKNFTSQTLVLPESASGVLRNINGLLQSWNKRGERIKLEDPEFNKLFVVYSNDQVESRYILSTSLMARLAEFQKKVDKKIYISFVNTKIYVAIAYSKDLFEPKVFETMAEFGPIKEYFEDLELALSIVHDLNLNTRIWSKQ